MSFKYMDSSKAPSSTPDFCLKVLLYFDTKGVGILSIFLKPLWAYAIPVGCAGPCIIQTYSLTWVLCDYSLAWVLCDCFKYQSLQYMQTSRVKGRHTTESK
jgi:hypothetical protein